MATTTPAPATPLSKERIVDEAIALLDADGAKAFSMRKLAQRLGVSTMSTYHHVADKDALVEGVAERIMAELERPAPDAEWSDAVRTLAWSFRSLTLAHPEAFRVLLAGARPTALLRTAEDVRSLLVDRGFDEHEALLVFRTFIRYLIGSTLSEHGGAEKRGAAAEEQFRYGLEALIAGIDARRG